MSVGSLMSLKMKKVYLYGSILVILLIVMIAVFGIIMLSMSSPACNADCNTLCDVNKECCYIRCVSSGCSNWGKDVDYYLSRYDYLVSLQDLEINYNRFNNSLLNNKRYYSTWPSCSEDLP